MDATEHVLLQEEFVKNHIQISSLKRELQLHVVLVIFSAFPFISSECPIFMMLLN